MEDPFGSTIQDQPYDEAMELDSASSHVSGYDDGNHDDSFGESLDEDDMGDELDPTMGHTMGDMGMDGTMPGMDDMDDMEGMEEPLSDEELLTGEFADMFGYTDAYVPREVEIPIKLQPFIPEYMPSVGDVDPFLKIPRPDGAFDQLGLMVADEPSLVQSDPTVLELRLRTALGGDGGAVTVRAIEPTKSALKNWIDSIDELHRNQAPTQISYSRPMPTIDDLMQIWPTEFEESLKMTSCSLPGPDIELTSTEYLKVVAALLDVPMEPGTEKEVLHLLFSLYMEVRDNGHYAADG